MWEQAEVTVVSRVISVAPPDLQELTPIHSSDCLPCQRGRGHTQRHTQKKKCVHTYKHCQWTIGGSGTCSIRWNLLWRLSCQCFLSPGAICVFFFVYECIYMRAGCRCLSWRTMETHLVVLSDLMSQTHRLSVSVSVSLAGSTAHHRCGITLAVDVCCFYSVYVDDLRQPTDVDAHFYHCKRHRQRGNGKDTDMPTEWFLTASFSFLCSLRVSLCVCLSSSHASSHTYARTNTHASIVH